MIHRGEIKLVHDGEVVRFHAYVSLRIMKTFIEKFRQDAKHLPGECWIDIFPEERAEKKQPKYVVPPPVVRPPAIYDNKRWDEEK